MGFIGLPELIVLAAVVLLVFGRKRLPALGSSLRSAGIGFKRGLVGPTAGDVIEGDARVASTAAPAAAVAPEPIVRPEPAAPRAR